MYIIIVNSFFQPELLDKSNDIEHEFSDHEVYHGDNMFTSVEHGEEANMMLTGDNLLPAPRIVSFKYFF